MRKIFISILMVVGVGCAGSPDVEDPVVTIDANDPTSPPSEKKEERDAGVDLPQPTSPSSPPAPVPSDRMCPAAHPDVSAALALMWSPDAAPPSGATIESRGVTRADGCLVRVGIAKQPTKTTLRTNDAAPTRWTIFLEKRDLFDAEETCLQPKGYRVIADSFAEPHALMASHFVDGRLFAIAYDVEPTIDAPVEMRLIQYDWATGDELRHAVMAVEGYEPNVPPVGAPFSLNVNDCDLTLYGDGVFPGAGGTNVGVWRATYRSFLGTIPQLPMSASEARYEFGGTNQSH